MPTPSPVLFFQMKNPGRQSVAPPPSLHAFPLLLHHKILTPLAPTSGFREEGTEAPDGDMSCPRSQNSALTRWRPAEVIRISDTTRHHCTFATCIRSGRGVASRPSTLVLVQLGQGQDWNQDASGSGAKGFTGDTTVKWAPWVRASLDTQCLSQAFRGSGRGSTRH